ncbi:alpha-L-fucosidase-domain-containing protein, partial [Parasitella parasitica]
TNEWINGQHQVVQVNLHNLNSKWAQDTQVHVSSEQVRTVEPGHVRAIAPGHVHTVRVIVQAHLAVSNRPVSVSCSFSGRRLMKTTVPLSLRQTSQFHATSASVQQHRSPYWLKQSKFGIFIHWGLYSVPSWAPVGESYAEWYWWRMNHMDDPAYKYHRKRYGDNFEYDDFSAHWKPVHFDPRSWLRLVNKSRAKYFVFTTKHHDGIALFNTNVTDRSTMHLLQTKRDFVKELMDVAEREYPQLKRGLYFSLPEWYHPQYKDDSLGWHGPPLNPYTGQQVKYTGSRAITDFVNELQVPQFQELVGYKPDILWCDIGGIHNSSVWQSSYFNQALQSGKQVAVNDRCGDASASDFTTVEYKAVVDTPTRFWEATRGMDPYSFGYNRETTPEAYASASDLIQDLVDAVSRGGNFLLNIGPKASGQVPQPMIDRLTTIGSWLDAVGESIFDTVPYWITSARGQLRFTASQDGRSVYVFSFKKRLEGRQTLRVATPLPIQRNATITLLNNIHNTAVEWQY